MNLFTFSRSKQFKSKCTKKTIKESENFVAVSANEMATSTRPTRGTAKVMVMVMGMETETETTWGQQRDKCQHAPQHKHNLQHFSKRIMTKHFLISKNETETETEPTTECLTVCKQDSNKNTLPHPHPHTHTHRQLTGAPANTPNGSQVLKSLLL